MYAGSSTSTTAQAQLHAFVRNVTAPNLDDSSGYYEEGDEDAAAHLISPTATHIHPHTHFNCVVNTRTTAGVDTAMELSQQSTQGTQSTQDSQSMDDTSQSSSAESASDCSATGSGAAASALAAKASTVGAVDVDAGGAGGPGTAVEQQLSVSQYLYVVASLCQVHLL